MSLIARRQRVLAVASGGGHWIQLLRVRPAFADREVVYVTTIRGYESSVEPARVHVVTDANRWQRLRLAWMLFQMLIIFVRVRPHIVISTGAAPGYAAIRLGKLFRARTIWLDSIANAEQLSMSGTLALKHADLCLSQWASVAQASGARYGGSVL